MGLLGLSAYSTVQRTKEVAVRKVLGASVSGIVQLLSRDFLQLIVLAFLVASPLTWWLMHGWLTDFAYRIRISWIDFLIAGLLAVAIALLTISLNAVRAARANPVDSLRRNRGRSHGMGSFARNGGHLPYWKKISVAP